VKASRLSYRYDCATKTAGSCAAVQHSIAGNLHVYIDLAGSCASCAASSRSLMLIVKRAALAVLGRMHLAVEEQRFMFTHAHVLSFWTWASFWSVLRFQLDPCRTATQRLWP
jgi:hypothetical protein